MTTDQKLELAEQKIRWFIKNRSVAQYALSELAEAAQLVKEAKERVQDTLPQIQDVLNGISEIKPLPVKLSGVMVEVPPSND